MRILIALVSLAAGVWAEDRTLNTLTSGLSQLINPGNQPVAYPPPPPVEQGYGLPAEHQMYGVPVPEPPQGFTVQSGYEGFIFPTGPAKDTGLEHTLGALGGVALGYKLLTHLLPFPFNKIALFLGTKVGFWLLGLLLLLLVGGATTTAVCAFTPLCTISFLGLGAFNRESTRALLTQDRLDQATQFVHDALDKYRELQGRLGKEKKSKQEVEAREGKTLRKPAGNDIQESDKQRDEEPAKNTLDK